VVETQLAAIWERILGVRPIGVNDNFFELGGHSLLAVNLFGQIEKTFGKALPLAKLFEAPTIAGLADILRRDGWTSAWSSLVPIHTGGARNPLFLVHAGHGNVLLYRQLAEHLGPDQPVYGLQSEALSGNGRFSATIEKMAATYVKDIMSVRPHGPYILGGYCLGGIIAFEIAQQLTALGKIVEAVILLDTYNPSAVSRATTLACTPVHWLQNLYFHAVNTVSVGRTDRQQFLGEKVDIAATRLESTLRAAGLTLKRLGGNTRHRGGRVAVKRLNDRAASRYVPKPYSGHVVLIRPKGYFVGFTDPSYGWSDIVRSTLVVRELPVYPKGMLIEPFCRVLADTIRTETDQAARLRADSAVVAMRRSRFRQAV
jgi:thioesterase domain-containing protein/acyl carrier protein